MSKTASAKHRKTVPGFEHIQTKGGIEEYRLKKNGLRVLYLHRPDTGVLTTNITYLVGAADEAVGESGIAHMLEHMVFKPTTFDLEKGITGGGAMQFERETGCILNANTWKDRTTYFFNYPTEYMDRAVEIEAERMTGVILTPQELTPEQGNVLSEFDMYNGDPHFALAVQLVSTAYHSHPYGHETIGYREDIEQYTAEKLERFYRNYYRPDNATFTVIGDIDRETALKTVKKHFGHIENPDSPIPRHGIREPKQEGIRRITIERPSTTNIVSIGFKHPGFGGKDWLITNLMLDVLTDGPESILHTAFVDTGKVSSVDAMQEPTKDENLAILSLTLAPGQSHADIERAVFDVIESAPKERVAKLVKKAKASFLTDELFARDNSLRITQELTEFIASGDWTRYVEYPEQIQAITAAEVLACLRTSFTSRNLTIGHFIGT